MGIKIQQNRNGSLTLYDMVGEHMLHQIYFGYTKKQAIADFKKVCAEEAAKEICEVRADNTEL